MSKEYDEDDAVKFIRSSLNPEIAKLYADDQILNVIDMIWDYYEANGMLDIDLDNFDDDDDLEEPETLAANIAEYASRMLRRDKGAIIDPAHLVDIIAAELRYEDSIFP